MYELISKWVDEYKSGYSLPRSLYTAKEAFEYDMHSVFYDNWIYAATEADVPNPGDYYCFGMHNNSILICRDDNGELRAFHNSCCHRGSLVCPEGRKNVAKLVCPYHQWTYNLDGKLIFVPQANDKFDISSYSLKPIHLKNIGGLIFICLSDNPPASIEYAAKNLTPYVDIYKLAEMKLASQSDIVENGNWKTVMENNRECYHCKSNHPELLTPLSEFDFGFDISNANPADLREYEKHSKMLEAKKSEWQTCNLPYEEQAFLNDSWYRVARLPLANGSLSHTTDGKLGCKKLLAPFSQPESSSLSIWTHPNSWHHFACDHVITFKAIPVNAEQTLVRTKWLVHKDAQEGVDYDLEHLTNCWVNTNLQDKRLVENNFAGIKGDGYNPGPYSPVTEQYVDNFTSWYVNQIKQSLDSSH